MKLTQAVLMSLCALGSSVSTLLLQNSIVSGSQARADPGSITTRRIDHEGRTRISLDADRSGAGPSIRLLDQKGNWQMDIGSTQGGTPSIALVDANNKLKLFIAVDSDGRPRIEFSGANGEGTLLHLGVGPTEDG